MTVVAAIALPERGATIIGCDQRVGPLMLPTKWVRRGVWAFGVSGVCRALPLIAAGPEVPQDSPLAVGIWLRNALLEDGFQPLEEGGGGPKVFDVSVLLARAGRLWLLDGSLTPLAVPAGQLMATGSGREYARGAAHALGEAPPEDRVRAAVQAAIDLEYEGCGGEPIVEWLST